MVNGNCIVAAHLSKLPLTILLLSTATQLWDGMAFDKIPVMHVMSYFSVYNYYRDEQNGRWLSVFVWVQFHLQDAGIVSLQHSYTFSSINVPYSVGEEKSVDKTALGRMT